MPFPLWTSSYITMDIDIDVKRDLVKILEGKR